MEKCTAVVFFVFTENNHYASYDFQGYNLFSSRGPLSVDPAKYESS
jgi:hypothetical protein